MSKERASPSTGEIRSEDFRLNGRIWIESSSGTFIGYGRIILLERIKEYGSISKAARSMNMSYRHAWEIVESMNRQAKTPLVITEIGGKGGGGARLTEVGERAIELFWIFYEDFRRFLKREIHKWDLF